MENYEVCSVQYCAQQSCTVQCLEVTKMTPSVQVTVRLRTVTCTDGVILVTSRQHFDKIRAV